MKRGYKIRIYPNEEQVVALNNQFGAARWIYNFGYIISALSGEVQLGKTKSKASPKISSSLKLQN
jgi:transposase